MLSLESLIDGALRSTMIMVITSIHILIGMVVLIMARLMLPMESTHIHSTLATGTLQRFTTELDTLQCLDKNKTLL